MVGSLFIAMFLIALAQARAIVTNKCKHTVWISSFPFDGSHHTENIPINSGGRYQEPWRLGQLEGSVSSVTIKISTRPVDLRRPVDEINMDYFITNENKSTVSTGLSILTGTKLSKHVSFHSCTDPYHDYHVCDATDEVEVVLCGDFRTTPPKDDATLEQIQACYQTNSGDESKDHDSFPGFITCIPGDCDNHAKSIDVGHCQARVGYAGREPLRIKERASAPPDALLEEKHDGLLCQIVQKYHPGVKNCSKEALEDYARVLYPCLCEPELKPLSMGVPCENVARFLQGIYPDITKPSNATGDNYTPHCKCAGNVSQCLDAELMKISKSPQHTVQRPRNDRKRDDRECLSNYCEPAIPGVLCSEARDEMAQLVKVLGSDDAGTEYWKRVFDDNPKTCPRRQPRFTRKGRPLICISKLCRLLGHEKKCKAVRKRLNKGVYFDKPFKGVEFTYDRKKCGN